MVHFVLEPKLTQEGRPSISLVGFYDSVPLFRQGEIVTPSPDTSLEEIQKKIKVHNVAAQFGASQSTVDAIYNMALTACLVDSYSETADPKFLPMADNAFQKATTHLNPQTHGVVHLAAASALSYFHYEAYMRERIRREDRFLEPEISHYLFQRSADSAIFAELLAQDGITSSDMVAGFRARQAIRDAGDDIEDQELDEKRGGVNLFNLTHGDKGPIRRIVQSTVNSARHLNIPRALQRAIEEEYEITKALLH